MHVIKSNATGKYVARPGSEKSYTTKLEDAAIFDSRASANKHTCENEIIIDVRSILLVNS
jgi:hypothetical protein